MRTFDNEWERDRCINATIDQHDLSRREIRDLFLWSFVLCCNFVEKSLKGVKYAIIKFKRKAYFMGRNEALLKDCDESLFVEELDQIGGFAPVSIIEDRMGISKRETNAGLVRAWKAQQCIRIWGPDPKRNKHQVLWYLHTDTNYHHYDCDVWPVAIIKHVLPIILKFDLCDADRAWANKCDIWFRQNSGLSKKQCQSLNEVWVRVKNKKWGCYSLRKKYKWED